MRGRFVKKIERPKGYVNIDEIYEALNGIEKEEDYEYGDYGEVLSKWTTCDYGEVWDAIYCCDVIKAVSLDRIKEARDEIKNLTIEIQTNYESYEVVETDNILAILDKLITESEE